MAVDFLSLASHTFTVRVGGEDVAVGLPTPEQRAEIWAELSRTSKPEADPLETSRFHGTRLAGLCLHATVASDYTVEQWEQVVHGSGVNGNQDIVRLVAAALKACGFKDILADGEEVLDRTEDADDSLGN